MEKARVNFLNVTMDICYKTFFYFAKHKDKRTKNNLEKKRNHYILGGVCVCGGGGYSDFYLLHRLTLFFGGQNFEIYYFGGFGTFPTIF